MPPKRGANYTPELYEAIGRLIVGCTALDAAITELIRVYSWLSTEDAMVIVHHQQFSNKIDALRALLSMRAESDLPAGLVKTVNDAKDVYDYRSTLVHAAWTVGPKGTDPLTERITARGKLKISRKHQPESKIREYAQRADEIAALLESFRDLI